jgi:pimeloyl-ACP methyl ester carboxylesterase
MVNYPGYGGSTGPADLAAIPPAALAVYDHVAKLAGGKPIFLAGNSLGTTAALYVAASRPTAGLILQNPPALRNLILTRFGWWNLWLLAGPIALQVPKDLDSPTNAAKVTAPAVFVLADDDTLVVPANQRKTVNAYAGPKRVIRLKGGHNDSISGDAERELVAGFDWLLAPR